MSNIHQGHIALAAFIKQWLFETSGNDNWVTATQSFCEEAANGEYMPSSADIALSMVLCLIEQNRQGVEHWAKAIDSQELQRIADQLVSMASSMGSDDSSVSESIKSFCQHMGDEDIAEDLLDDAIQAELLKRMVGQITNQYPHRVHELIEIASKSNPNRYAQVFLKRVGRCYLSGYFEECVVMCRSALESCLKAEIPNDDCFQYQVTKGIFIQLADRIHAAWKTGRIDSSLHDQANKIRQLGNELVHDSRARTSQNEALELIAATLEILTVV